jgi:hypothetical protein
MTPNVPNVTFFSKRLRVKKVQPKYIYNFIKDFHLYMDNNE